MAIPSISELSLLKALWRQQPLSAREIHDAVVDEMGWSFSSTRKTLERMLEKGMVSQQVRHGVQVYEAVAEKVDTLAAFAHDFGRRIMEIDTPLARHHVHRQQAGGRGRTGPAGTIAAGLAAEDGDDDGKAGAA